MIAGLDVGYSDTKVISGDRRACFASVTGTPETGAFSLSGQDQGIVLTAPAHVAIGGAAVQQARFLDRREDRNWIESDTYHYLILAALTEITRATNATIDLVTGLPIAFYNDRQQLADRLLGQHQVTRARRRGQTLTINSCRVIPQPFGTLLNEALDLDGQISNPDLAGGFVAVIDIGGKTVNLLAAERMADISRQTASIDAGAWHIVRSIREHLDRQCPGLELRDHQIAAAIQGRQVKYYGQVVDLTNIVEATLGHLAGQIVGQASQLWNGAAHLDAILITGGGACLLGETLAEHWPQARIVADPVFGNAAGYWKLARRIAGKGSGHD